MLRALVAGPPPSGRKSIVARVPPREEVDVVLDLTAHLKPPPQALDLLIRTAVSRVD